MSGTGGRLYAAICGNCPPLAKLLKAYCVYVDNVPYTKLNHLFSTATILDAFKGASCVHVIDYGINHGVQWPCLIQHLATRPEGPPHLRITGIFFISVHDFLLSITLANHLILIFICLELLDTIDKLRDMVWDMLYWSYHVKGKNLGAISTISY